MLKIPFKEAMEASKSTYADIGDAGNRLMPETWPHVTASFTIPPGSQVFTIGSCFARNVEKTLQNLGYYLPTLELYEPEKGPTPVDNGVINKYSPPGIYQELAWTADMLARNAEVTLENCREMILPVGDGKIVDVYLNSTACTEEQFLKRRKVIYNIFRHAFDSPYVTITLGLIENWYDTETGRYIQEMPFDRRQVYKAALAGRFELHQLGYEEAYDYTRKSVELLKKLNPAVKILITTSPVSLRRTFTKDDVILANSFSKCMLRTVCGMIARNFDNVDYFPSYENVMLTRDWSVFGKDFIHVSTSFVSKIVHNLRGIYLSPGDDEEKKRMADATYLFDVGNYLEFLDQAKGLPETPQLVLKSSQALERTGDLPQALTFARRAVELAQWPEFSNHLARLLVLNKQYAEACAIFQSDYVPQDMQRYYADALEASGKKAEAIAYLESINEPISAMNRCRSSPACTAGPGGWRRRKSFCRRRSRPIPGYRSFTAISASCWSR